MCVAYESELIDTINNLQDQLDELREENAELYRQNRSYKLWMNRCIDRIKVMQK